jgi:hypothetical protein
MRLNVRLPGARVVAAAWLAAALWTSPPAFAQRAGPALPDLLARLGAYVDRFQTTFSNVVSEERYEQSVIPSGRPAVGGARLRSRVLVSDFLLVRMPETNDWLPFRDVFEVDGSPVRDHQDRLAQLFVRPQFNSRQRAGEITEESARYNIGIVRTVNQPLLALHVAQASEQRRFSFSSPKVDPSVAGSAVAIGFDERERPSVIRGPGDRDMPMGGRLWIDAATGMLLKTEVTVTTTAVDATITTLFQVDSHFDVAIPIQMHEDYRRPDGTRTTGTAKYSHFRQFNVDVKYDAGRGGDRRPF